MVKPKRKRTPARRNLDRSKAHERRVARWFGTVRTPLSGGASRHTRSDTLHPKLYIEVKGAQGPTGTNGWLWRWLGRFGPEKCIIEAVGPGGLCVTSSQCIDGLKVSRWSMYPDDVPNAARDLWGDTVEKAQHEEKVPVLVLVLKGRRGFWIITTSGRLGVIKYAREEALRGEA